MENPNQYKDSLYFLFAIFGVVFAAYISILITRIGLGELYLWDLAPPIFSGVLMLYFGLMWVKTPNYAGQPPEETQKKKKWGIFDTIIIGFGSNNTFRTIVLVIDLVVLSLVVLQSFVMKQIGILAQPPATIGLVVFMEVFAIILLIAMLVLRKFKMFKGRIKELYKTVDGPALALSTLGFLLWVWVLVAFLYFPNSH